MMLMILPPLLCFRAPTTLIYDIYYDAADNTPLCWRVVACCRASAFFHMPLADVALFSYAMLILFRRLLPPPLRRHLRCHALTLF